MIGKLRAMFSGLLAGVGIYACDAVSLKELKPGVSTGFEVRERMGQPAMEWDNADGTLTWEFPRGPEGVVTYMIVIGPDNVLREIRQVLTEENFARVEKGLTREQVRRLIGKPARTTTFPLSNEEVWDWKYRGEGRPNTREFFHVHFDPGGKVIRTSRTAEPLG